MEFLSCNDYYWRYWCSDNDIDYSEDLDLDEVAWQMAASIEQSIDDFIDCETNKPDGIAVGWARAFLSEVDFYEIAKHQVDEWVEENQDE